MPNSGRPFTFASELGHKGIDLVGGKASRLLGHNPHSDIDPLKKRQSRNRYVRWLITQWRTSAQFRVVSSVLTLCSVVIFFVAFLLQSQTTEQLLGSKTSDAVEQIGRLRATVEQQIAATDDGSSELSRADAARAALTDRGLSNQAGEESAGSFEPVLYIPGNGVREDVISPANLDIPQQLRELVSGNRVGYQYTTLNLNGKPSKALVVGTPTSSRIKNLQLYLVYPLAGEEKTLSIIRGIILTSGIVLALLSAGIAWVVTRQVVRPVREAAAIASRYSDGHFDERMEDMGEDEIGQLASSFNSMAQSLSEKIEQMEELGNLQRRFTSDVSHELRTPLTTVRMASDILKDSIEDNDHIDPAAKRSAVLLESELDRFESLLADLLEISRYDSQMAQLSVESVDFRDCVTTALQAVQHLCEGAGTELTVHMPQEPIMADVDSRRVERIVRNLVANALDHSESKPVVVSVAASHSVAAISVRDFGVGLKEGEQNLVFNRFWRSDPSRVRRSGGTGLGLAISLEDALLHGGSLDVWGAEGRGACFRLTVPRRHGDTVTSSPLPLCPEDEQLALNSGLAPYESVAHVDEVMHRGRNQGSRDSALPSQLVEHMVSGSQTSEPADRSLRADSASTLPEEQHDEET